MHHMTYIGYENLFDGFILSFASPLLFVQDLNTSRWEN